MTLPVWTTNPFTPLSMTDIELEFVGNRQQNVPITLSDYYSDSYTGYVSSDRVGYPFGIETPIPQIGDTISISNFYGASSVSYTINTDRVSYDEGDVIIFSITAPLADGTKLYWTIEDATVNISIAPAARFLPTASRNILYTPQQLVASGGTGPYTYAVTYGSLPPGITLASNGLITGTPTSIGTSLFAVTASDSADNSGYKIYSSAGGSTWTQQVSGLTTSTTYYVSGAYAQIQRLKYVPGGNLYLSGAIIPGSLLCGYVFAGFTSGFYWYYLSGQPTIPSPYSSTLSPWNGAGITSLGFFAGSTNTGIAVNVSIDSSGNYTPAALVFKIYS